MIQRPWHLCLYFLKLGSLGFGGPLALIAMMQKDLIEDQHLLPKDDFFEALALIKSMPGPVAVQLVAFLSQQRFGAFTAILCVTCFILPAALLMVLFAGFYGAMKTSPETQSVLIGMQAGALLLILGACFNLVKPYKEDLIFQIIFILSMGLLMLLKIAEPILILSMGFISCLLPSLLSKKTNSLKIWAGFDLIWICMKAGALSFGTGLAIIPLLQKDFVNQHQWITSQEFMDAVALGQLTPGPVSVTVTFVGYKVAGIAGALVATVAIFLPGVFHMITWFPRVLEWLKAQTWIKNFVRGAIGAICASILGALWNLLPEVPRWSLLIPLVLWALSFKYKIPSWALVLGSGASWCLVSIFVP